MILNKKVTLVLVASLTALLAESKEPKLVETGLSFGWESKYVAEGRDDGDGHSIIYTEAALECKNFTLSLLAVDGEDLREYYSGLSYGTEFSGFGLSAGVQAVMLESDSNDLEFCLGVEREAVGIVFGAETVYSNLMDGYFGQLYLSKAYTYLEDSLLLELCAIQGFDFGYRTETYDGANHFEINLAFAYVLSEIFTLNTHIAHSWAQSDVKRDGGKDLTWGGIAILAEF